MKEEVKNQIFEKMKQILKLNQEIEELLKTEKATKAKTEEKKFGIYCEQCSKEITPVDLEIRGEPRHFDAEQIAWFSQKAHSKNICWVCQHEVSDSEK